MSTISTIHTLVPNANIPLGYYDEDNIRFVQTKIKEVLKRVFIQDILFDRASIIRYMERALLERREPVPNMNQRAVMYGANEYMVHQLDVEKHLRWEENFLATSGLYDPIADMGRYDPRSAKISNRLGVPRAYGTVRFYFT